MNNTDREIKVAETKLGFFMDKIRNIYSTQENIKNRMEKVNTKMKLMFVGDNGAKEATDKEEEMPDNFEHAFNLIEIQQKEMLEILDDTNSLV